MWSTCLREPPRCRSKPWECRSRLRSWAPRLGRSSRRGRRRSTRRRPRFSSRTPARPATRGRSLDTALDSEAKAATSVTVLRGEPGPTTVQLTYASRDPVQAQQVAAKLAAIVTKGSGESTGTAELLDAPDLPTSPTGAGYRG